VEVCTAEVKVWMKLFSELLAAILNGVTITTTVTTLIVYKYQESWIWSLNMWYGPEKKEAAM
jgi:hypothetical protein